MEEELLMELTDASGNLGNCKLTMTKQPITDINDKAYHVDLDDNTGTESFNEHWNYDTLEEARIRFRMLAEVMMVTMLT